jgi:hypothetical protein
MVAVAVVGPHVWTSQRLPHVYGQRPLWRACGQPRDAWLPQSETFSWANAFSGNAFSVSAFWASASSASASSGNVFWASAS